MDLLPKEYIRMEVDGRIVGGGEILLDRMLVSEELEKALFDGNFILAFSLAVKENKLPWQDIADLKDAAAFQNELNKVNEEG